MAAFKSCYRCKERYPGCHSVCPKYLNDKAEYEKQKKYTKAHEAVMLTNYDFDKIIYNSLKRRKRRN